MLKGIKFDFLDNLSDRTLEVMIAVVGIVTALVVLFYGTIAVNPQVAINPFPPSRASAAAAEGTPVAGGEAEPTTFVFPPTWTATPRPLASGTPTRRATNTRLPTLTPTVTPTTTPTPVPTSTPTPRPTQRPPTRVPTRPPTVAPTPIPPYLLDGMWVRPNCDWSGFHGIVWAANGLPYPGATIRVWRNGMQDYRYGSSGSDGIFQIAIGEDEANGRWWVQVIENNQAASTETGVDMGGGCDFGVQEVKTDWKRRQ